MTPDQITEARALIERIKFEAVNSEIDRRLAGTIIRVLAEALDEIERLREALLDATANLAGAASAYRTFARRHLSQGIGEVDALFSTRATDFDKAVMRARAALKGDPE